MKIQPWLSAENERQRWEEPCLVSSGPSAAPPSVEAGPEIACESSEPLGIRA
jgi:hypothetical protein